VLDSLIAHRLERHARVADALQAAAAGTADDLLGQVYADVTEAQLPVARFSLWAHLRHLGSEGRAEPMGAPPGGDTIETTWRWVPGTPDASPDLSRHADSSRSAAV
jgi:Beta-lactamase associated winged helix domain